MALGFLTNKEAREKITGLETRVAELEGDIESANTAAESARNELATANEALSEAQSDLSNAKERICELEGIAARVPELEEAAKVTAEKISNEASQLAAAIGLTEPLPDANTGEPKSILAQFIALEGEDATRFYKANRKEIIAAQLNS
jgi:chromosome segregation ATPase